MATTVYKQLATMQDLTIGYGKVTQKRNGVDIELDEIRLSPGIPHASFFGVVGDGVTDDSAAMTIALATDEMIDITGLNVFLGSPVTCPASGLRITSNNVDNSTISGGNYLGFSVSGGVIDLTNFTISGFNDGTELNELNFATAFARIELNSTIDSIYVNRVKTKNCRVGIVANSGITNDFTPTPTITINNVEIYNSTFNDCSMGISLRCVVKGSTIIGNRFKDIIGKGRDVGGIYIFLDAQPFDDPIYELMGNHLITNNRFDTIVNRTTTGDSTAGNNYETHAAIVSGNKVEMSNNILVDVTGNIHDTEGLYIKARHAIITDNIFVDSGGNQGSINIKGTQEDNPSNPSTPFGDRVIVSNNMVVYTKNTYNNDSNIIDLELMGVNVESSNGIKVTDNIIIGANTTGILYNGGEGSKNANNDISNNKVYDFSGTRILSIRGAFQDMQISNNSASEIKSDAKTVTFLTLDGAVANRGLAYKNTDITDNTFVCGKETLNDTGLELSFIRCVGSNYDMDNINITNNKVIIDTVTATPVGVKFTDAGCIGTNFTIKRNKFLYNGGRATIQPIIWGSFVLASYDIDIEFDYYTDDNGNYTAVQAMLQQEDTSVWSKIHVVSTRLGVPGIMEINESEYLGWNSAGVLTTISNVAETKIGNGVTLGSYFVVTGEFLKVLINGNDGEEYIHHVKFQAKTV